ncbi:Solute-binding protein [subsurface metagenome]
MEKELAAAAVPAKAEYEWRIADFYVEGCDAALCVEYFGHLLSGMSDGRIDAKYYPSGALGGYEETFDACSIGELEFAMVSPYSSYQELLGIKGLPFAGSTYAKADELFFGEGLIRKVIDDGWEKVGVKHIFAVEGSMHCRICVKHPLVTPEDFAGLKFRVPPAKVYEEIFKRITKGITPSAVGQVMPWGEYYSALERGVVDGGINSMNVYESMRFFEVAPYWTDINTNYNFDSVIMNLDLYNSLPADIKEIVDKAGWAAEHFCRSECRAGYAASEARCIAGGATFIHLTDEQRQVFIDKVNPLDLYEELYKDMLEKNYPGENMFEQIIDEIKAVEGWK